MLKNYGKRLISLLLVLIMVMSMMPVNVFAYAADSDEHTEENSADDHDHEHTDECDTDHLYRATYTASSFLTELMGENATVSVAYQNVQDKIDEMLSWYLGSTDATQAEIEAAVAAMDSDTVWMAQVEIADIVAEAEATLTEDELELLSAENATLAAFSTELDKVSADPNLLATTVSVLDGKITVTDSVGNGSVSSNTVTVSATGSYFSTQTNTITITNATENKANVSFSYTVSGIGTGDSCTFDGSDTSNGTYSYTGTLTAGQSVTVTLAAWGSGTAKIVFSSFTFEPIVDADVTFVYDSSLGSVTVAGVTVANGGTATVSANGATVSATVNGGTFLGWTDGDGKIISTSASFSLVPTAGMTVKAVFAKDGGAAWFGVGSVVTEDGGLLGSDTYSISYSYLFDDLATATAITSSANNGIVLLSSGILPAGTYTIPSGVTMLIPFDDANTLYTTEPESDGTYTTPTAYRTLTLASGAELVVNGKLSLSAKHKYAQGSHTDGGAPTGAVSFVKTESGSKITVNSGGALYVYGYITGSGSVIANSGATVYELFQISDFRGGSQTTDMQNRVFPLSQYYVQNIEVPMTLYAGATEYSYTTIYMSSMAFSSSVAFIGPSGCMFNLTNGYVVKKYDGTKDRLVVESYGDISVSPIEMTVGTSGINSADYVLGINSNITLNANSGTITLGQDVALLPGSKIVVGEGVTCTLNSGNIVYLYDADQWGAYASSTDKTFVPVAYAPGKTYTRTDADLVDACIEVYGTVDASAGYLYTTASGAAIIGHGGAVVKIGVATKPETVTYQLSQTTSTYAEIPITVAKLQHGDGTYTTPDTVTREYAYTNNRWVCSTHSDTDYSSTVTTPATCTAAGERTYTCKYCGDSYTETIDKLTHNYITVSGKEATCTENGLTDGSQCQYCGDWKTEQEVIAATGHEEVVDAAKAATCTEDGLTEGSHCSVCGETIIAQTVVPALGHSYDEGVETKAPGCVAVGQKTYTCSVCGGTKTESIPATGHTESVTPGYDATCTTAGVEDKIVCSVCNAIIQDATEIPALGHDYSVEQSRTDATCTTAGSVTYKCSRCDATKTDAIAALGHSEETLAAVAPTCTATGLTEGKKCSVCGITTVAQTTVAATGHTEETVAGYAATCTEDGLTDGKKCSVCNITIVEQTVIEKTGHAYSAKVTDPTCEEQGYTTYSCANCDSSYVDDYVDALGHSYGEGIVTTEPTCTEAGIKTITCTRCDDSYTEAVDATGHSYSSVVTDPTCEEQGYTTYSCANCDSSYVDDYVDATGHTVVTTAGKEPTCTETGLTEGKHCSVCNAVIQAQESIPARHTYGEPTVTEPSCTQTGSKLYQCQNCEYNYTETIAATGHSYTSEITKAATCTETGVATYTCSVCTNTYTETIAATGHDYVGVVTKAATCAEAGVKTYTCSGCGDSYTEEIAKLEHSYNSVVTAPTCVDQGYTTHTCANCGDSYVDTYVDALGHDIVTVEAKAATCTENGNEAGQYCTRCDAETVGGETIAALGHDYVGEVTTAPSCTEEGVKTFICSRCDDSYTEAAAATGHSYNSVVTSPTCVDQGYTTYTCSACGDSYVDDHLNALGHIEADAVVENNVDATADTDGSYDTVVYCKVCGVELSRVTTVVPATGHTEGEAVVENEIAATCTTDGSYDTVVYCTVCGVELSRVTTVVPAKGHPEVVDEAKAPTCTATGLTEGIHCSVCDEVLVAQEIVPMLDHTEGEAVVENEIAANCTTDGSYDTVVYCTVCNAEISRAATFVDALGHTEVVDEAVDATCTATGLTEGSHCEVCDEVLVAQTVVAALGHDYVGEVTTAPSCTETGVKTFTCSRCDDSYTETVAATGHSYSSVVTAATCTAAGYTTYTCSACGYTYTANETPALGHISGTPVTENVTEATCSAEGSYDNVVYCTVCRGEVSRETVTVEKIPHTEGDAVVENETAANCTTDGSYDTVVYCTVCDVELSRETITVPAKGHTEVVDEAVDATCTTDGKTEGSHCDVCGDILVAQTVVPATGHTKVVDAAVDATCTATGLTEGSHCSVCNEVLVAQTVVEALGHTEVIDAAVEATCTTAGKTEGSHCSVCNEVLVAQEEISALGHDYKAVVTAPRCEEVGYTTYTCSVCGDSYTADEVAATGHSYESVVTAPTCTTDGYTTYTCSVCGDSYVADEETAFGHSYEAVVTPPTCGEQGYTTYSCANCDDSYVTDYVEALGHTAGTPVTENEIAAGCQAAGSYDTVVYCSVCDVELSRETITVPAMGHTAGTSVTENVTEATCSAAGSYDTVVYCSACDVELSRETVTVEKIPHTEGDAVTENDIAATPDENGSYDTVVYCSVCGEELSRVSTVVPATGHDSHNVTIIPAVAPTCTATGLTAGKYCEDCQKTLVAQEAVPATGHKYEYVKAVAATCTENGSTSGTYCSACGIFAVEPTVIPATGHTYVIDAGVEPTCLLPGLSEGKHCSVCGEVFAEQTVVPATGHTEVIDPAVAATCTATGLTEGKHCANCGTVLVAQQKTTNTGHSYEAVVTAPTCTVAGYTTYYCANCDSSYVANETEALGHDYKSVVTDPTCTEAGYTTHTCTRCDHTYTDSSVDALGHTEAIDAAVAPTCTETGLTEGSHCSVCDAVLKAQTAVSAMGHTIVEVPAINPTCDKPGYTFGTYCSVCGITITEQTVSPALGHTEVIDEAVEATCTASGLTEGKHCSVCNATIVAQETIEALGHADVIDEAKAPTCTETGLTEGIHCDRCEETLIAQETIDALGHSEVIDAAVAPTCTASGLTEGKHCDRCEETLVAQETIDALGHTEVIDEAKAPTCTETGLTEGKHCSVCNAVLTAQETVDALSHDYESVVTDPTCLARGYTTHTCTRCGDSYVDSYIDALGHNEVTDAAVAPDCVNTGLTEGKHCDRCGEILIAQQTISALEHNYKSVVTAPTCTEIGYTTHTCTRCGDTYTDTEVPALGHVEIIDAAVPATCTETGLTEGKHCDRCKETLVAQTVVDALGHTEVIDDAVDATCTATGLTEGKHCSVCDTVLVAQTVVDALGHTEVIDEAVGATCTATGLTEGKHCSVCTTVLTAQETVDALGHDIVVDAAVDATCTATGLTEGSHCTRCDDQTVAQTVIPMLDHTEVIDSAVDATCTATGLTEGSHCSVCATVLTAQEIVPMLDHAYETVVTAPTCEGRGYTTYTCPDCGASKEGDYVDPTGHSYETIPAVPATCTETGLTAGRKCSVCGKIGTEQTVVPETGHSYEAVVTAPTCTEAGYTTYTCSACGDSYVADEVEALDHSYEAVVTAPTCTETGYTTYTCSVCGDSYVADEVEALDHSYEAVVTAPTCTEAGYTTYTCSVCGDSYVADEVEANGHNENAVVTPPTCTSTGYTTYTCTVCGNVREADKTATIPHDVVTVTTKQPTCTEDGESVTSCTVCGYVSKTEVVEMLGHNEIIDPAVAATCTATGLTEGSHCVTCGEILVEQTVVEKLAHTEEIIAAVAPTCSAIGYTEGTKCSVCGTVITAPTEVAKIAHTEEIIAAVAPTCTEAGLTEGKKCSVCGEVTLAQKSDPATGHTRVVIPAVPATCTSTGLSEGSKCSVCGTILLAQEETAKIAHTEAISTAVPATCTETGLKAGKYCSVCGETIVAQEEVPALGHNIVIDAAVEPTCSSTGLTEGSHCTRCNDATVAQDVVDALPHTEVIDAAVDATCTTTGLTEGKHCSVCNTVLTAQTVVPVLGHEEEILAEVAPTCVKTGLEEGVKCSVCGEVLVKQEIIPATGHTPVVIPAVSATCTETGLAEGSKCSVCDTVLTAQETVPALGHTEAVDAAVAPTCTNTGLTAGKHCSVCNEVLVEQTVAPALGHTEIIDKAVAATCTATGLTEGKHCSVCGEVLVAQTTVDALGHTPVTDAAVAPTCTNTGLAEGSHCSVCNTVLVKQETVDALGHTEVVDPAVAANCLETGLTAGKHCSVCGVVIIAQEVTDALGHDLKHYEAKKPTYTSVGWLAYDECTRCDYTTYVEIDKLEEPVISDYETFMENLIILEDMAQNYALENPGKDPLALVIKYIRTGVDRYNSGSWGIMAGYEDAGFAEYVLETQEKYNETIEEEEYKLKVIGLKNIENFYLPNGDYVDFGHMFGTMDITYHNKTSVNHADVAGWAGDLVDLLSTADRHEVTGTLEEMIETISEEYLGVSLAEEDIFSMTDMYGDLDGFYAMQELYALEEYEKGDMHEIFSGYFTEELTAVMRADYFLENRLEGASTQLNIRDAVYSEYTANNVVATLEGTRDFTSDSLADLRKACCYAFADYLCELAGDWVEINGNPYYTVFSAEKSTLAPGITQEIKYAYSADDKQMVFYIATADITRDDVHVYANYKDNDPTEWGMQRVIDQANAAQNKYGDPESDQYIENYNVIASVNADGFNMVTGEPGGLLVMGGVEWHPVDGGGFFAIMEDGTAMIGTKDDYETYKDDIAEAVGGFGTTLIKDGKISITATSNYYTNRASRTAVGITKTGKVVFMVLDGRQEPFSCGGSMIEIAQIMLEAGCVHAINLDGGGSTTFVAKQEGADELSVVNSPSDGFARSVATTLMMVSTAPSSTAFDHALIETDTAYMTVGASVQMTASGVSATGNTAEMPEGAYWAVSDESVATITEDGVLTAVANGDVDVYVMVDGAVIGTKTMHVVIPDNIYFTKTNMDAVYGETITLPVVALYQNKEVAITVNDVVFSLSAPEAGVIDGFTFTGIEESGIKTVTVTAALAANTETTGSISVALYNQGEATFDFDQATGGDRQLAWDRQVSNSTTSDSITYLVVDPNEDMVTSYIFAIDMTQIPIPEQLADLTSMLPGADVEGASAWTFLLQLAERVSTLTVVTPTITFDPNFDVDYSELTLVNEYFTLESAALDEESNTLTLTLRWKDQTQAIDPATANPICIVSGIKLTPKEDAAWDAKDRLSVVNSGKVSYKIYLRANALYTFANKEENQKTYGIYPFDNQDVIINGSTEKGGWFSDIYAEFSDSYTLVKSLKNGWYNEDGGYAYYIDGEKLTGVKAVDGIYYDFGENGVNIGQNPYTGMFVEDGAKYYAQFGKLASGWFAVDGDYYYFDPTTHKAHTGVSAVGSMTYTFDEEGVLILGAFVETEKGTRYYWAGTLVARAWIETDDGILYSNDDGYIVYGHYPVIENTNDPAVWWYFDEETGIRQHLSDGFIEFNGEDYYCEDGVWTYGAVQVEDGIVFCGTNGKLRQNTSAYIDSTTEHTAGLENGYYWCDENGYVQKDGFATIEGDVYYFTNYQKAKGFTKVGNDYYFFNASSGKMYTDVTLWVGANSYGIEGGKYYFGTDGKMVIESDVLYGDVNLDGEVTAVDAAMAYSYVNGKINLTDEQFIAADVNGDGEVTAVDAAMIYSYVNGKLDKFPVEG